MPSICLAAHLLAAGLFTGAAAGPALQACLLTDRSPGAKTCSCAQEVADQTLSPEDQAVAANIIAEPDLFETYLYDDRPKAQAFVERYRAWGEATAKRCRSLR